LGTSSANLVMGAIRRATTELKLITVATIHQVRENSQVLQSLFDEYNLTSKVCFPYFKAIKT